MFTKEILITSPEDAKKFVDIANKYQDFPINLNNGNYLIDGHSIMGLLSLDMNNPTMLVTEEEPTEEFLNDMKDFFVEK